MRPAYEDAGDINNELRVAAAISKKMNADLMKMSKGCHVDFVAVKNGKPTALIEIKVRTNSSSKYKTYMISLNKIINCLLYAQVLNVPVFLFVEWDDVSGFIPITHTLVRECSIVQQEKNFRGDPLDKEPCLHIPINRFTFY